ncbi:hypothetical protein [Kitasatospora sp. NPDC088134]|uniref:hypothetical protein n=1 Tax=Kitasatospora sp. NPDC088134 TaxID=3364071 RepID=UPI0038304877
MSMTLTTASGAYQAGRSFWMLLEVVAGVAVGWAVTRRWRNPTAAMPADLPRVNALRARRRLLSIGATVAAVALFGGWYAVLGGGLRHPTATGPAYRTFQPPEAVGDYHLMKGAAAAELQARLAPGGDPHEEHWFYSSAAEPERVTLMLSANADYSHPERNPASKEWLEDYGGAAGMRDGTPFDAGPLGGTLRCGHLGTTGTLCRWADRNVRAGVMLADGGDLAEAAALTLRFRTAGER